MVYFHFNVNFEGIALGNSREFAINRSFESHGLVLFLVSSHPLTDQFIFAAASLEMAVPQSFVPSFMGNLLHHCFGTSIFLNQKLKVQPLHYLLFNDHVYAKIVISQIRCTSTLTFKNQGDSSLSGWVDLHLWCPLFLLHSSMSMKQVVSPLFRSWCSTTRRWQMVWPVPYSTASPSGIRVIMAALTPTTTPGRLIVPTSSWSINWVSFQSPLLIYCPICLPF